MARGQAAGTLVLWASLAMTGCIEPDADWVPAPPQSADARGLDPSDTIASSRIDGDTTAALLFFFVVLPCGLIGGWSLFWWLQHRKRAAVERAFDPKAPLANGHAVIVGQVELEPGATGPAIQLAIQQEGKDIKVKHGWSHSWTERSREVRVRPFWVRRFTGELVRVEPDERVVLRDDLSRVERRSHAERVRFAELTPGETVHVSGSLFGANPSGTGAAYRAAATEPVLRPGRIGPMVVSTERPGATSSERAAFHRGWLVGVAVLALALPTVVFPTVALLGLTGQTVRARPAATRHWQVYHKPKHGYGYYVQHYGLRSVREVGGGAQVLTDECSEAVWSCAQSRACPEVRYTVSALSDGVVQIGVDGQLTDGRAILLGVVAAALLLAYPFSVFGSRPWYLQRRIVDSGTGKIPDFIPPAR